LFECLGSQRLLQLIECHIDRFTGAGIQLEYDLEAGCSLNQRENGTVTLGFLSSDRISFPMTEDFPVFHLMRAKLNRGPFLSFDEIKRFALPAMRHFWTIQGENRHFPLMNIGIERLGGNDIGIVVTMVTGEIPNDLVDGTHRRWVLKSLDDLLNEGLYLQYFGTISHSLRMSAAPGCVGTEFDAGRTPGMMQGDFPGLQDGIEV